MLTCLPQSICNWDFIVTGGPQGDARLSFDWLREIGTIEYGGDYCEVLKGSFLSGQWALQLRDKRLADAHKPDAFFRRFTITHGAGQFEVNAVSPFSRAYQIEARGHIVGQIAPEHPMTRRARIQCDPSVPVAVQLFAFWLVVITWRRAANNNS